MKKSVVLIPVTCVMLSSCIFNLRSCAIDYCGGDPCPPSDISIEIRYETKTLPLVDMAEPYDIKGEELEIFYFYEGETPYVDIKDFILSLDGFFDTSKIKFEEDTEKEKLVLSYDDAHKITFDFRYDLITADSYKDFKCYSFDLSTPDTEHLSVTNEYRYRDSSFEIDLYHYHSLSGYYVDGSYTLPLFLLNILFCSTCDFNVYYNGDKCFARAGEITSFDEYYQCNKNKKDIPDRIRRSSGTSLVFALDYFYGLKMDKGIVDGFAPMYSRFGGYVDDPEPLESYKWCQDFLYYKLDDVNCSVPLPSYYCDKSKIREHGYWFTEYMKNYFDRLEAQTELREASISDPQSIRYEDDMAIITLDSFKTGTQEEIYDENGNVKDDAWQHDSYHYMHRCMDEISSNPSIKKITLDLSLNRGGDIASMLRVLGFMTDRTIPYSTYDLLDDEYRIDRYKVDVDGDGVFEGDAYDDYEWNLLVGLSTFGEAATMTSIFKEMGLGNVIGKRTGGGSCETMSTILADGNGITFSGPVVRGYMTNTDGVKKKFNYVDMGVRVNIDLEYEDFYDGAALLEAINSVTAE